MAITITDPNTRPINITDTIQVIDSTGFIYLYKWSAVNNFVDSTTGAITATTITASSSISTVGVTNTGGQIDSVTEVDADYEVLATDKVLMVTSAADPGAITITFPSDLIATKGKWEIKDKTGNCNTYNITLATEGAETIDGGAVGANILDVNYQSKTVQSDGTNLFII